jgi:hypothetical protein
MMVVSFDAVAASLPYSNWVGFGLVNILSLGELQAHAQLYRKFYWKSKDKLPDS